MLRPLSAAALIPLVAACTPPGTSSDITRVANSVPADAMRACVSATAAERDVPEALVTIVSFRPETTGPALTMDANGEGILCKLDTEGEVTSLTLL